MNPHQVHHAFGQVDASLVTHNLAHFTECGILHFHTEPRCIALVIAKVASVVEHSDSYLRGADWYPLFRQDVRSSWALKEEKISTPRLRGISNAYSGRILDQYVDRRVDPLYTQTAVKN